MKDLIKFPTTPRGDYVYIYRSIEDDPSTQEIYNEQQADSMVEAGEAVILPYKDSYLDPKGI